jgi:thymidylate kinase
METKVVLVEGFSGSGKTTLTESLAAYLVTQAFTVLVIGEEASKSVANITAILRDPDIDITPATEILLRLAREFERMKLLDESRGRYDFILIDGGLPSLLSRIPYYNGTTTKYDALVAELRDRLGYYDLVNCRLDFDRCWTRILARGHSRSLNKEASGPEVNRSFWSIQQQAITRLGGNRVAEYEIDMNANPEDALRALLQSAAFSDSRAGRE